MNKEKNFLVEYLEFLEEKFNIQSLEKDYLEKINQSDIPTLEKFSDELRKKKTQLLNLTLLQLALHFKSQDLVKVLVDKGVNLDVGRYDDRGHYRLPLAEAILNDMFSSASYLIQNGCVVQTCVQKEITPLSAAISKSNLELADQILKKGGDINCINLDINSSLLHLTAAHDKIKETKWLLKNGIKYTTNPLGQTPLHLSCENNSLKVTSFLLTKFPLNSCDVAGYSPLSYASFRRHDKMLKLIIFFTYNFENRFTDDLNRFFSLCYNFEIQNFLLKLDLKVENPTMFLRHCLFYAIRLGCPSIVHLFLKLGATYEPDNYTLSEDPTVSLNLAITKTNPLQIDRVQRLRNYRFTPSTNISHACQTIASQSNFYILRLTQLSRIAIFKSIFKPNKSFNYHTAVKSLPLPKKVIQFLTFDGIILIE